MANNISIPLSCWTEFRKLPPNHQRVGQHFYDFMELHKVTSSENKVWCDVLYNASDTLAKEMIEAVLDQNN